MNYNDIISLVNNNFEIQIGYQDLGLAMKNHYHPISVTEAEFNYITKTIIDNNLKNGYEVATAFGISALAAGLGFKKTNGMLVSMDAYIEEKHNHCGAYVNLQGTYENADGYRLANFLSEKYEVPVNFEVGWSPKDTKDILSKTYDLDKEKLDYVFIDAGHWESAIINDISSVLDYINKEKYIIFFHDTHCFTDNVNSFCKEKLGKTPTIVFGNNAGVKHYNLSYISNFQ